MTLEGLVVTAETTGGDVLERVSESEASCVRDEVGDDGYQVLADTALVEGGAVPSFAAPMAACLSEDNFVLYSTALIAANAGADSDSSRDCFAALGRANPDLTYITFGVGAEYLASFDPMRIRPFARDFYDCFTDSEMVRFTVRTLDLIAATAPITGRDFLDAMSDDVIKCFTDALGMNREQFEMLVETAFAAGSSSTTAVPDCITNETLIEIVVALSSSLIGGLSDESADCVRAFGAANPEYLALMAAGDYDPATMTEAEFAEVSIRGLDITDCLTATEILAMQALVIELVT